MNDKTKETVPQVGAPDPELENSPIYDEDDDTAPAPELEQGGACYFNGIAYPIGQYVQSGGELLHCEERGVWVRRGEVRPKGIGE